MSKCACVHCMYRSLCVYACPCPNACLSETHSASSHTRTLSQPSGGSLRKLQVLRGQGEQGEGPALPGGGEGEGPGVPQSAGSAAGEGEARG